jgi:hypothetical protein
VFCRLNIDDLEAAGFSDDSFMRLFLSELQEIVTANVGDLEGKESTWQDDLAKLEVAPRLVPGQREAIKAGLDELFGFREIVKQIQKLLGCPSPRYSGKARRLMERVKRTCAWSVLLRMVPEPASFTRSQLSSFFRLKQNARHGVHSRGWQSAKAVSIWRVSFGKMHLGIHRMATKHVSNRLTANQSISAVLLAFWALQCATCVADLAFIRPASAPVAPFSPRRSPGLTLTAYLPQEGDAGATHALSSFQADMKCRGARLRSSSLPLSRCEQMSGQA